MMYLVLYDTEIKLYIVKIVEKINIIIYVGESYYKFSFLILYHDVMYKFLLTQPIF